MKFWKLYGVKIITLIVITLLFGINGADAQVPQPSDVFGFQPGADYKLASYDQMLKYYGRLDEASDRVKKVTIGETVLGRFGPKNFVRIPILIGLTNLSGKLPI